MARRCRALARDRGRSIRHTEGFTYQASRLPREPPAAVHTLDAEIRVAKVSRAFVGLDDNHGRLGLRSGRIEQCRKSPDRRPVERVASEMLLAGLPNGE